MVTATGFFKQPDRLAYLLADSATWRTLVGETTLVNAKKYIHLHGTPEGGNQYRVPPRAIISWQDQDTFAIQRVSLGSWGGNGSLTLSIELLVPVAHKVGTDDAYNWFMNQIGAIASEMAAKAGVGEPVTGETHLNMTSMSRIDGPWYMREDEIEILDPVSYLQPQIMWIVFGVEYMQ